MDHDSNSLVAFLETVHPYDSLPRDEMARVAASFSRSHYDDTAVIYSAGEPMTGIYLILAGSVEVLEPSGGLVSLLGPRNSFGERGLMRDGIAVTTARATDGAEILMLPEAEFRRLIASYPAFERFFHRGRQTDSRAADISTRKVGDLIARAPISVGPGVTIRDAAGIMRDAHISCVAVVEGDRLVGIVTARDFTNKVLAAGMDPGAPVSAVMAPDPMVLTPDSLGSDVLNRMLEHRIGHLPVVDDGKLVGMITQTDLVRFQAVSSALLVRDAATAGTVAELAENTARIPRLLVQLVGGGSAHEVVTRLVTDIADTVTRRLLAMAEAELGPSPVPYLWLACGSQGRQEQTGVSDQDNCLMIDDAATDDDMAYFAKLAKIVCDGLDACGYVYCPGDMMATNPQWRQRVAVWRDYFRRWVTTPDPMAQMLASVMFDLRPIGGAAGLYTDLQAEVLELAAKNSIFVAHMVSNSLKHTPPLGLLRGFATIRSGEHKNHIDLKMNGVVPVVDLGRVYALIGQLPAANTRARLEAATEAGIISPSGARDLIEAYDLIAEVRLEHQARRVKAGDRPDNFIAPSELSDFERSHLRDAFVVVRTMQSAVGSSRGARA
ncbi:MAG: cyclic nucleotide-binding/CBS domain-containing protein [Rhodobacterales bacterium]|nr:MAG: cyclic nucleotide-binding/CBS domain-containing protein [Rhodobacterales bacterium]